MPWGRAENAGQAGCRFGGGQVGFSTKEEVRPWSGSSTADTHGLLSLSWSCFHWILPGKPAFPVASPGEGCHPDFRTCTAWEVARISSLLASQTINFSPQYKENSKLQDLA